MVGNRTIIKESFYAFNTLISSFLIVILTTPNCIQQHISIILNSFKCIMNSEKIPKKEKIVTPRRNELFFSPSVYLTIRSGWHWTQIELSATVSQISTTSVWSQYFKMISVCRSILWGKCSYFFKYVALVKSINDNQMKQK